MRIENAYRRDLAYIHDAGYGRIATDAAERLIAELTGIGCRDGTIVDLGCGSGILAHHLVGAGYQVVGIDVSEAMVALARTRVPDAEFQVSSFVSTDLPACVAVTAIGEVFNYSFDTANDAGTRDALFRRAHEALLPGGLLMFDVAGSERTRTRGTHRTFTEGPDCVSVFEVSRDEQPGTPVTPGSPRSRS